MSLFLTLPVAVQAAPAQGRRSRSRAPASQSASGQAPAGVDGIVETEGAQVYAEPDFDAQKIGTFSSGQKVRISRGTTGQTAKFHKVRVGPKIGYISDVDVSVVGSQSADAKSSNRKKRKRMEAPREIGPGLRRPIFFHHFVGLLGGVISYKESISGVNASAELIDYGLKVSGPDTLFRGPVTELNLALHYGAPSYYSPLSKLGPTGFLLFTDALILVPVFSRDRFTGLLGFGPLAVYSSFHVYNDNREQTLSMLNLGLSTMVGFTVHVGGSTALRVEGKYFFEKQSYKALQAALMVEF